MYLALYRKYRPKIFDDVISQSHITTTLKNQIISNKTAHAYLFTGSRGTGKTTCSKILAMAVNCNNVIDGNPCLICNTCVGIETGKILDVVEIDAASNSRVDDIRQIIDEAVYMPTTCKYRVYIIDEAHMLSTAAFNALLKTMEEPPEHVKFILATTEINKVPATILSRCQRFDFKRIISTDIVNTLISIANKEDFNLTNEAATLIARVSDGAMRDALSILDQCVSFSNDITLEKVNLAVGIISNSHIFSLSKFIINGDASGAISLIHELYSSSKNLQILLEELIFHFRNIMLLLSTDDYQNFMVLLPDENNEMLKYMEIVDLDRILFYMDIMQVYLDKLSRSYDKKLTLELCVIRLCKALPYVKEELPADKKDLKKSYQVKNIIHDKDDKNVFNNQLDNSNQVEKKKVETDISQDKSIKHLDLWNDILQELSIIDTRLYGILFGSKAFVNDKNLFIDSPLSLTAKMIKDNGNISKLLEIVEQKTGESYKIMVKSHSNRLPDINKVDEFLDNAKKYGIEINEN